jgi:hypothetical protein
MEVVVANNNVIAGVFATHAFISKMEELVVLYDDTFGESKIEALPVLIQTPLIADIMSIR